MSIPVNLVFEDELSEFVMIKLLNDFGNKYYLGISYNAHGFGYIKSNINGFNQAAIATTFFVLTDLDNHSCAPFVKNTWLVQPVQPNLIFRVAVREVEAWLLSDIEGFAAYLNVPKLHFPSNPELIPDPKQVLINLVRKCRKRAIREDVVPLNSNAKIGPNYNGRLMEFVMNHWNIFKAMERSDSLSRTYRSLKNFQYTAPNSIA